MERPARTTAQQLHLFKVPAVTKAQGELLCRTHLVAIRGSSPRLKRNQKQFLSPVCRNDKKYWLKKSPEEVFFFFFKNMSNILLFQLQTFCMMIFFPFWVVHLSVRLIYDGGWSSYYICIMVTLGIRPGHLWDACTWSQRHHGFLPITPPELIFPIKNHLYLSLDLSGCSTWVRCPCTLRFYLLSQILVRIVGDFVRGPQITVVD